MVGVIFAIMVGKYAITRYGEKQYFAGEVATYMAAQQIPKKAVVKQQTYYNWTSMYWQSDVYIRHNHKTYRYEYVDGSTLTLEVYTDPDNDTLSDAQIAKLGLYPLLKYNDYD